MVKWLMVIGAIWFLCISAAFSEELKIERLQEDIPATLPSVSWVYHFDAADGYFGVIIDDQQIFRLYSADGEAVFETQVRDPYRYFIVSMKDNPGLILLGAADFTDNKYYDVYDFEGNPVFQNLKTDNVIMTLPGKDIYYSISEMGSFNGPPRIYGGDGEVLRTLKTEASLGDITACGDSALVFQDGWDIKVLSVPGFEVKKEIRVNDDPRGLSILVSTISGDRTKYAFSTADKFAVIDLPSGKTIFIPKGDKSAPRSAKIALSQDGSFLVTCRYLGKGYKVDVYRRTGGSYERIVADYYLPEEFKNLQDFGEQFIGNDLCAIDFIAKPEGVLLHKTFLFRVSGEGWTEPDWTVLNGFISFDSPEWPEERKFRVNSIAPAMTSVVHIGE